MIDNFRIFQNPSTSSGMLLVSAAVLAMVVSNSPLSSIYDSLISLPVIVQVGNFGIDKPLLLWINDGLMAVFFFLVGLELKRECLQGNLSDPKEVALPAVGAFGGMLMPALIYAAINWSDPVALKGWAVPTATDIAFALAILGLLGDRVPVALKVLLVSIAIFDDVGAIVIIALFYTEEISATALMVTTLCLLLLLSMNRKGVMKKTPYILIGLVMCVTAEIRCARNTCGGTDRTLHTHPQSGSGGFASPRTRSGFTH
jgi:Na+:H+ antiporter, NhaA family